MVLRFHNRKSQGGTDLCPCFSKCLQGMALQAFFNPRPSFYFYLIWRQFFKVKNKEDAEKNRILDVHEGKRMDCNSLA